jgi:hypothetical protein
MSEARYMPTFEHFNFFIAAQIKFAAKNDLKEVMENPQKSMEKSFDDLLNTLDKSEDKKIRLEMSRALMYLGFCEMHQLAQQMSEEIEKIVGDSIRGNDGKH